MPATRTANGAPMKASQTTQCAGQIEVAPFALSWAGMAQNAAPENAQMSNESALTRSSHDLNLLAAISIATVRKSIPTHVSSGPRVNVVVSCSPIKSA